MMPLLSSLLLLAAGQPGLPQAIASSPEARVAMQRVGSCLADRSPEFAAETLAMDFRSTRYRQRLQNLVRNNESCFREQGMRVAGLAVAGAVAERLLSRDPTPLNVRLARAARGTAATGYSPTDEVAMCIVRSVPDDVSRLFASEVTGTAEAEAAAALAPIVQRCNRTARPVEITTPGLRAILATAAFRTLRRAAPATTAGN